MDCEEYISINDVDDHSEKCFHKISDKTTNTNFSAPNDLNIQLNDKMKKLFKTIVDKITNL